jgi:hypothetical protein
MRVTQVSEWPASGLTRRAAALGAVVALLLSRTLPAFAAQADATTPTASQVPGGVALLPLGPSPQRPVASLNPAMGEVPVPVLVIGDPPVKPGSMSGSTASSGRSATRFHPNVMPSNG